MKFQRRCDVGQLALSIFSKLHVLSLCTNMHQCNYLPPTGSAVYLDKIDNSVWKSYEPHPHDVILLCLPQSLRVEILQEFRGTLRIMLFVIWMRCKQWIHQRDYSHCFLFLPRKWALQHLPAGVPGGWESGVCICLPWMCRPLLILALTVVADKNDIGDKVTDHLMKYIPSLRLPEFSLDRAADYLESWINGTLPLKPLLDVSACAD